MIKIKFYFEYFLVLVLDAALRLLSWESAQSLGAALGGFSRKIMRSRWSMTLKSLSAAFPEKSEEERQAIALEAWQNTGRLLAEMIKSRHLTIEELSHYVHFENLEVYSRTLEEGKGVLANIGHLGNWEVGGIVLTGLGYPLGGLGRAMKNPLTDRWLTQTRSRFGAQVFAHRNPFFQAVRWIKQGKPLAILIDHNMYRAGIFVPFFGRPAATSTLSGLLAVKLGCPILSVRVRREGPHIYVRFEGPLRADSSADSEEEVKRLTLEMTRIIEGYIRLRPGEWLWGHNRWKRAPTDSDTFFSGLPQNSQPL